MQPSLYEDETYRVRGAIFEVYREMGCGFLEPVYQECTERELTMCGIPFASQRELQLHYKGDPLIQTYRPDLICFEKVIVELKAVKEFAPEHRAQLFNYLKATGLRLGLLITLETTRKQRSNASSYEKKDAKESRSLNHGRHGPHGQMRTRKMKTCNSKRVRGTRVIEHTYSLFCVSLSMWSVPCVVKGIS